MRISFYRLAASAALLLALTACSVNAEVSDYIAPVLVLLIGALIGGATALVIGYMIGHHNGRASLTTTDAMAILQAAQLRVLTPAQYEALLRDARSRGIVVSHERHTQ